MAVETINQSLFCWNITKVNTEHKCTVKIDTYTQPVKGLDILARLITFGGWNEVGNKKKRWNKFKYDLYLRFFKIAPLGLLLFTLLAFSWWALWGNHLKCFCLYSAVNPKPSTLSFGHVTVNCRSSDTGLHHWPSLVKSPLQIGEYDTSLLWEPCWFRVPSIF